MTGDGLARFQQRVWRDPELQARLLAIPERSAFVAAVVETAQAAGDSCTADEVEAAMQGNQRAWLERWIR